MAEVPKKLGKYHILERIAQGGMAEIYKAKSIGIAGFEKILAVKRIKPSIAGEPRFVRNFIDEARIAVSLNHRNIVQVFDFGKDEGELFLAMELLEGVDLHVAIEAARRNGEQIPAALGCYILADIAAGLDYAHQKCDSQGNPLGIVHCDVSPHNILLSYEGFVKILDFGVARARFVAAPKSKRLRGKPRYMAPEQTFGDSPTPASDVFVIGILAWELFADRRLFDGDTILEILKSVRATAVENIALIRPDLPEFLSTTIMAALQRHPGRRCSASEFSRQLARASRELSDQSGARSLAAWLSRTFPPEVEETETTSTMTVSLRKNPEFAPTETVQSTRFSSAQDSPAEIIANEVPTEYEITEVGSVFQPPTVSTLIDKRRVVVSLLLLDGGTPDRRREISLALCDLAYKRSAVIHDSSESSVVAVFGLEMAGEDDIANAMHFAIDAAELVADSSARIDSTDRIELRSAARAGVVAQRYGTEYRLRGDALREARELARGGESFKPLLSGGTGRTATAQFRFRELPSRKLRSRKLRVLELVGPQSHDDRTRALRDRRGRFIGRSEILQTIWDRYYQSMEEGQQYGVLVTGSVGVGKSRVISEFVAGLPTHASPPLLFTMVATERAIDAPFTIIINYLEVALGLPPNRGKRARSLLSLRLARTLQDSGQSKERITDTCHTIEMAMELRDGALRGGAHETPAGLRERCIKSLRLCHRAFTKQQQSVLIIENVHFADPASIDILRTVLNPDAGSIPCLVLMSCRERSPIPEFPNTTELCLQELSKDERETLIADRLGDVSSNEIVAKVSKRTGGNPLYIEEVCQNIRDIGWDETPAGVRDSVLARIDRLSAQNRALLQRAAVIGESFRAPILEELAGSAIASHLQELVEVGLLQRQDTADFATHGGEFTFRHGLIREVVYSSLTTRARQATHAELGQLLSLRDKAGSDEPPALIARHLELGGLSQPAAEYWSQAGLASLAAFESSTAIAAFDRALAIYAKLPGPERLALKEQHKSALFGRANAYRDQGNFEGQGDDLAALEPLCEAGSLSMATLLSQMAQRELRNGAFEQAIGTAKRAVDTAQACNSPLLEGEAQRTIGEARERLGDFEKGMLSTNRAIAIFENIGATTPEIRARISLARSFLMQAQYEKALRIYQPILSDIQQLHDPKLERLATNHLSAIHLCLGNFEDAMRFAEQGMRLCMADGDMARAGDNISMCGIILSSVGQFHAAREQFLRAIELHRSTKSRWSLADSLVYHAANEAALNEFSAALDICAESYRYGAELNTPYLLCNAKLTEARILLSRNQPGDKNLAREAAEEAEIIAQAGKLPGSRAMALSRQAQALSADNLLQAKTVSDAAIQILLQRSHIEGPEEEIFFTHHLILEQLAEPEANSFLLRSRDEVERKLSAMDSQDWRHSYAQDVFLNAHILTESTDLTTTEDI